MFSPVPGVAAHGPWVSTASATQSVSSAQRVRGLPFSTPEEMIAASRAGLPRFDLDAMTKAGTAARARNIGPTSARALKFSLPQGKVSIQQLIAALRQIDVTPMEKAGIEATALLDFDNTVIGGDVFKDFLALLLMRTQLPDANAKRVARLFVDISDGKVEPRTLENQSTNAMLERALKMVDTDKLSLSRVFILVIAAVAGVRESKLTIVAEELFFRGLPGKPPYITKFFGFGNPGASAVGLARTLIARRISPHIMTLGLPTVARVGAQFLGIPPEHVHGFELEVVDGVCTGRAVDARLLGKHKVGDTLVSPTPIIVMGDTLSDAPMLSRATVRGFAVDPEQDVIDHIKKNGADLTVLTYKG